ncbi:DUF4384 domain-containing protein, partial [Thermodesulfobacteriota bacterium]
SGMLIVSVPESEVKRIEKKLRPGRRQSEWINLIKESSEELFKSSDKYNGKRVAVGSITDSDKRISALSLFIAEQIEMSMINSLADSSDVISTKELKAEMESWRLGVKGLVNEKNSTQAGKLLGVDIFCFGNYTFLGDTISLNLKMIETKSGKILKGKSTMISTDPNIIAMSKKFASDIDTTSKSSSETSADSEKSATDQKIDSDSTVALNMKADRKSDEKPKVRVDIWSERAKFSGGDKIKFFVKTDKDCYLTLIHVNSEGDMTMLFPNYYAQSNHVKGGKTYLVPPEDAGFDFIASEPFGYEIVRAIASLKPLYGLGLDGDKFSESNPFLSVTKDALSVSRGLNLNAKKAKKGEWAEAVIKIKIIP